MYMGQLAMNFNVNFKQDMLNKAMNNWCTVIWKKHVFLLYYILYDIRDAIATKIEIVWK